MKTDVGTGGYCGGIACTRSAPTERRATQVVRVHGRACPPRKKGARPVLQHRTGASNCGRQMTDHSLAHLPRWKRWGIYALAVLTMTGIAPMALAALLTWLCEAVGWWLLVPSCVIVGRLAWRAVLS